MTPAELAALDAALTIPAPAPPEPVPAPDTTILPPPLARASASGEVAEPPPDDWCELRLETRKGKIRFTWKCADGDMRDSDWKLRERSNTSLAMFVGFLKSFVAKSFGRVPVINPTNIAPLDKPGQSE